MISKRIEFYWMPKRKFPWARVKLQEWSIGKLYRLVLSTHAFCVLKSMKTEELDEEKSMQLIKTSFSFWLERERKVYGIDSDFLSLTGKIAPFLSHRVLQKKNRDSRWNFSYSSKLWTFDDLILENVRKFRITNRRSNSRNICYSSHTRQPNKRDIKVTRNVCSIITETANHFIPF